MKPKNSTSKMDCKTCHKNVSIHLSELCRTCRPKKPNKGKIARAKRAAAKAAESEPAKAKLTLVVDNTLRDLLEQDDGFGI